MQCISKGQRLSLTLEILKLRSELGRRRFWPYFTLNGLSSAMAGKSEAIIVADCSDAGASGGCLVICLDVCLVACLVVCEADVCWFLARRVTAGGV